MTPDPTQDSATLTRLKASLADVERRVVRACERAARPRSAVRLIGVSKRQPVDLIRAAYSLGLRDFGESYVQELASKCDQLSDLPELRFHAIGHLQRNKVRSLIKVAKACPRLCLHSVDSEPLIAELEKRAAAERVKLEVLVEVNVAHEAQKSGCLPEQLPRLTQTLRDADHLKLLGLMAIPPGAEQPEASRDHFRALRELRDQHCSEAPRLSMGMSRDFEVAIEEGATDVRVGTAIFGLRGA